jgi:hypothetical protein
MRSDGSDKEVLEAVMDAVPTSTTLYMWAAGVYLHIKPKLMSEVVLTEALRTPPAITREVQQAVSIRRQRWVPDYSSAPSSLACEGRVRVVNHSWPDHSQGDDPKDCEACGRQVASWLASLHVGVTGNFFFFQWFVCLFVFE